MKFLWQWKWHNDEQRFGICSIISNKSAINLSKTKFSLIPKVKKYRHNDVMCAFSTSIYLTWFGLSLRIYVRHGKTKSINSNISENLGK